MALEARPFGLQFVLTKCKTVTKDWGEPPPNLSVYNFLIEVSDSFVYLDSAEASGKTKMNN